MLKTGKLTECCPPKPELGARALITHLQAADLGGLFKVLANDTRLRLLHEELGLPSLTLKSTVAAAPRLQGDFHVNASVSRSLVPPRRGEESSSDTP